MTPAIRTKSASVRAFILRMAAPEFSRRSWLSLGRQRPVCSFYQPRSRADRARAAPSLDLAASRTRSQRTRNHNLRKTLRAYPAHTAIKVILDKHSAHTLKETRAWLAYQPAHRFQFIFTPKHGSWLNLVEGFFSKLAPSVLRHIRVISKQELKDRIVQAMDYFNQQPVVHTWSYLLENAA